MLYPSPSLIDVAVWYHLKGWNLTELTSVQICLSEQILPDYKGLILILTPMTLRSGISLRGVTYIQTSHERSYLARGGITDRYPLISNNIPPRFPKNYLAVLHVKCAMSLFLLYNCQTFWCLVKNKVEACFHPSNVSILSLLPLCPKLLCLTILFSTLLPISHC